MPMPMAERQGSRLSIVSNDRATFHLQSGEILGGAARPT